MVREHNAPRSDANGRRFAGDMTDDHGRCRACDGGGAMMLGKPEAFEAEFLDMAGDIDRLLERLARCFTGPHRRKIKDRKRNPSGHCHIVMVSVRRRMPVP